MGHKTRDTVASRAIIQLQVIPKSTLNTAFIFKDHFVAALSLKAI
jgi:hypothetical protein